MQKVLCFGAVNIDNVFQVPHIVRAGETLTSLGLKLFPGGKGLNQSVSLAKAGACVYHAGKVGADGHEYITLMEQMGVHTQLMDLSGSKTGLALIQVDANGQNCIMLHPGANREISPDYLDTVLSEFEKGDILLVQNEVNLVGEMVRKAYDKGLSIALNPSPFDEKISTIDLAHITWLLVNEVEAHELSGQRDPEAIAAELLRRYPHMRLVLTLGREGVYYRDAHECQRHGVYDVPVVDTTAAGDTFTGFFLASVQKGEPVAEALRIASVASSLAVSREGAAVSIPTLAEVLDSKLTLEA